MGRVTGTLYASIYFVLCGMALAMIREAVTLMWVLWAMAVLMLVILCAFGYSLERFAPAESVRVCGARPSTFPSRRPRKQEGEVGYTRRAA